MSFLQQILYFLTDTANPVLRLFEISLLALGALAAFLVFFTTRDVLLRSRSFPFQLFAIVLSATVPILGFFLYLLIRPAATLRERDMEGMLRELVERGKPPASSAPPARGTLIAQAPEARGKGKAAQETASADAAAGSA